MISLRILTIFTFFVLITAEPVSFNACSGDAGDCVINAVRITPCPEAATNEACKIKRGRSAGIEFDFTTNFDSEKATHRAYWSTEVDLPLLDMDTDTCHFTPCPIVKDKQHTFNQSLPLSRKFPTGAYRIKWRVTADNNKECCFLTSIKLIR